EAGPFRRPRRDFLGRRASLAHAAVLELLAAAAGAGVVAADALLPVADRLLLGIRLTGVDGGLLLAGDVGGAGRVVLDGGAFDKGATGRLVELFHAEDQVGHALGDIRPHQLEGPHALALVLDLGIDLGVATQADA